MSNRASELTTLSIAEAGSLMARGELTATALTEAFLARIEAVDHKIASFVTLTADRARLELDLSLPGELPQTLVRDPVEKISL